MEFGLNMGYLMRKISFEQVVDIVAKAGFTAIDYQPDYRRDNWEALAYREFDVIAKAGLCVHQTHAPFNRYGTYTDDEYALYLDRVFRETQMSGAKYMVIHGDEFDFDNVEYTCENALRYNYEIFAPYVELASKHGIKLAFETVFADDLAKYHNRPRFCSAFEELEALINKFNSPNVCCCWDFGHAALSFGDAHPECIEKMGRHIECTHVQDCGHGQDLHLMPFLGEINWEACMSALAKTDYKGNLTYEMVYGNVPQNMGDAFAAYLMSTAETLKTFFDSGLKHS